jgi:DNA processing protein
MVPGDNSERGLPTTPMMTLFGDSVTPVPASLATVGRVDPGYPRRLLTLKDAPAVLWYRGCLPDPSRPAVAIVGSRAATGRGCQAARAWAAALAAEGWTIVSGGAFGIDAAAHQGALEVGGPTQAVLGCGADVVYPDRHQQLFERIAARGGGLMSELAPGTAPKAWHFPKRNRIVAALADALLVIEAGARSGALGTATLAGKLGRPVLAVPGSPGADSLVAGGAAAVSTLDDVRAVLAGKPLAAPILPERHAALVTALQAGPATPGVLAQRLGLTVSGVMGLLTEAELDGRVRRAGGSHYEVLRGH